MALKLKDKQKLNKYILNQGKVIERALIYRLSALLADLENHAKLSAGYDDDTSNLRSSIGGVVLNNGIPVHWKGFTSINRAMEGPVVGKDLAKQLIASNKDGIVLILVAGMEYATYVENYYNLNVLKQSELRMNRELPKILNKLKSKIK